MKCVLLNIKNVTRDKNHYISRVGINIFSFSLRFTVFSRFQSSDFPIECHVTDILRPGPGVNVRRRAEDHETRGDTGTISAEATLDTGGGIITALQGNNHQAMCLLVSCPRHHATCRLQTHCMDLCTADLYLCACFKNYKSEFTPEFIIICR